MSSPEVLDLAIVGGGIAGITHLYSARKAGLSALLLEKRDGVGGLWRELPAWQDIQIAPVDWAVGDLPLGGVAQPHIHANIQAWVDRFHLSENIRLGSPVQQARHDGRHWVLQTAQGPVQARHLVAATGAHNVAHVPECDRSSAGIQEFHSSQLREPKMLAGRDVLVVGGGASAFDLLDLCFAHQARRVMWVYRGIRWFFPTGKPKTVAGSVRPYTQLQASGLPIDQQNARLMEDLEGRYEKFGLQPIKPERPFDLRRDQLIPGRSRMLAGFADIERYAGEVKAIAGDEVVLDQDRRVRADMILWATGYRMDLSYFEDPAIAAPRSPSELAGRCRCIFRSVDAPELFFPAVGLDGIGSAPWACMLIARSIMSHIRGTAQLDMAPTDYTYNHLDIARFLSARDSGSFGGREGWKSLRDQMLQTPDDATYGFL